MGLGEKLKQLKLPQLKFPFRQNEGAPQKKAAARWMLLAGVAVLLVGVGILISVIVAKNLNNEASKKSRKELFENVIVKPEDVFLPDEPDFLPEIIPHRARRARWTEADGAEFWVDPREAEGAEKLKLELGQTIEKILESAPCGLLPLRCLSCYFLPR